MAVVLHEEFVILDVTDVAPSEALVAVCQEVPHQVDAGRSHPDLLGERQGLLVVHDVAVGADQGLREEGAFTNLGDRRFKELGDRTGG